MEPLVSLSLARTTQRVRLAFGTLAPGASKCFPLDVLVPGGKQAVGSEAWGWWGLPHRGGWL